MATFTDQLCEQVMYAVAKRIAKTAQTDPQAAADDFEQHAREMSIDERADFEQAIVNAAIRLAA